MDVKKAMQLLKDKGYKYTEKREDMLELFSKSNRYLTAKEVLEHLKTTYPGMSYDTIYRNLSLYANLGILETTELSGEKRFRFACVGDHHHHHFICMECGKTRHVDACPMEKIKEDFKGYDISGHKFEIYGKCPDCIQEHIHQSH